MTAFIFRNRYDRKYAQANGKNIFKMRVVPRGKCSSGFISSSRRPIEVKRFFLHQGRGDPNRSAIWWLEDAIYLRVDIIHIAGTHAYVPALVEGGTTLVSRTNQYGEAIHRCHPKAVRRRFYGADWPAIVAVTAFDRVPADQLAIWVDVGMWPCGNDSGEDGREARKQECAQSTRID